MRRLTTLCVAILVACASSPQPAAPAARRQVGLTLDEAKTLVAELEARQRDLSKSDPLREPKSLDDVLRILKRDQLDLFPAGVAFAETLQGPDAEALRAQIELAWGEAQSILSEVFVDASGQLKSAVTQLELRVVSGEGTDRDAQQLAALQETISKSDLLAEALSRLAAEHVGTGARLAREVIAKTPSSYIGYRVAADFYRLRQDWDDFDHMVQKIEQTNPGSNGLVFLRGTAALQRAKDVDGAQKLFREALQKDPQFTRAQAQLVLARTGVRDTYAEFQRLRALNPNHQIVVWAGEAITAAFEATRK